VDSPRQGPRPSRKGRRARGRSRRACTTQAKYYKPLLKDFFRLHFPVRPRWGDWSAHIAMEFNGDPPHMDLDNLAKALLDSAIGAAFHDDSQVARLLVERRRADREGIWMKLSPML